MKWKRTPIEVKAAIIEKKINTFASAQEIANELNIPERTASRVIGEELAKIGEESSAVADLLTRNNNLQSAADALIAEMIANKDESITIAQLSTLRESTFKQNQLIQWKNTENNKVVIEWSI